MIWGCFHKGRSAMSRVGEVPRRWAGEKPRLLLPSRSWGLVLASMSGLLGDSILGAITLLGLGGEIGPLIPNSPAFWRAGELLDTNVKGCFWALHSYRGLLESARLLVEETLITLGGSYCSSALSLELGVKFGRKCSSGFRHTITEHTCACQVSGWQNRTYGRWCIFLGWLR